MTALNKDIIREIKKSLGRFFSIFAIVLIGSAFFTGVKSSAPIMKHTADKYYDDNNLMDIKMLSNTGFTQEDVDEIKKVTGVLDVNASYSTDVLSKSGSKEEVIRIHGFSDSVNIPALVEGRYPANSGECVVENYILGHKKYKVGDKISVTSGDDINIDYILKKKEFKVVGIVNSPYYLSYEKGSSKIGNGSVAKFILINNEDFNLNVYNEIFITVDGAKSTNSYNDNYFDITDKVKDRLELLGEKRSKENQWHILDRKSHYSYVDYEGAADKVDAIAKVFPVFFFLVAALVCLTTMTRMVDEQRGNIGILKALGYSKAKIASKYIIYAILASSLGSIIGVIIGINLFPRVIFNAWAIMYSLPSVDIIFQPKLAIVTSILFIIITTAASFLACYKSLYESSSELMRPKPPKKGKKILLEKIGFIWKRLSFDNKVTLRNIFRYKKRFFMTVIGISGCTALLLAGFGIKNSTETIADIQFRKIINHDMEISMNTMSDIENSKIADYMKICKLNGQVNKKNINKEVTFIINSKNDKFKDFYTLRDRKSKDEKSLGDNGVIITEQLSKALEVSKGDKISIAINDNKDIQVIISDVVENYVDHYVYMTSKYYEKVTGSEVNDNTIIIKISDKESKNQLAKYLLSTYDVKSITSYASITDQFSDTISSLNYVIIVLIISAGALAFIVLYNLTNVNISERIREIATIKVLGFYNNEVSAYVYRENMILTILGAVVGCILGIGLHKYIMINIDMENVMFGRNIYAISFVYSFLLTILFSIAVNFVMYFKLIKVPMVESLKSVE